MQKNETNRSKLISPIPAFISERSLTRFLQIATHHYLTLKPCDRHVLPGPQPGHEYTLYVHIPFCESLCPYCSFNRFVYDPIKAESYFHSLREEIRRTASLGYKFTSMYIGGGTPTIHIDELIQTIDLARQLFPLKEVSCETNPNHLTPEIISKLESRVQRLSVGVQSFDDDLLKRMNRFNKYGSGAEILDRIRFAAPHFLSLNVDMIFNFPSQTPEILKNDIDNVIASGAQQVTFYPLMSSPSVESNLRQTVGKTDKRREWNYYNIINDGLKGPFRPLSSWTFVRNDTGMIDEYIANGDEYIGVGSGAFSWLQGTLYVNTFSLSVYHDAVQKYGFGISAKREYSTRARARYALMMTLFGRKSDIRKSLHLTRGIGLERFFLTISGAFQGNDLSRFGRYLSVVMMREFFIGVNNLRDTARLDLNPEELACATPEQFSIHSGLQPISNPIQHQNP